jgi:hypothetical protein
LKKTRQVFLPYVERGVVITLLTIDGNGDETIEVLLRVHQVRSSGSG